MITVIITAVLAVLSTVVGVWDKLTSRIRTALVLAIILIAIAAGSQVVQVIEKKHQLAQQLEKERLQLEKERLQLVTIQEQARTIEDAKLLNDSNLVEIDEASGGATRDDLAYIVDDSEPNIFVYQYSESERQYKSLRKPLDIIDDRRCNKRLDWGGACKDGVPKTLNRKMIDDLEGAAIDRQGNLYLTTSHSYAKDQTSDPARAVFLKTSLDGHVLEATRKLRKIIRLLFKRGLEDIAKNPVPEYVNKAHKLEIMQIEGLAIDNDNRIYLGFRAPLVDDQFALVLRTRTDQIFSDNPQFESFLLDLQVDGNKYGIVSLDYDVQNNRMIILGNSPQHYTSFPPVIWSWDVDVKDHKTIQSTATSLKVFNGEIFGLKLALGSRPAKPEVLLLIPKTDRIHLFFDAQGTGGQLDLIREGLNIKR